MNEKKLLGPFKPKKKFNLGIKDSDKDGYPDMVDCQPFNPNKQGKVGDWVKEKAEDVKSYVAHRAREKKYNKYKEEEFNIKKSEAYSQARESEEIKLAGERARFDAREKFKGYKKSKTQSFGDMPKGMTGGYFGFMPPTKTPKREKEPTFSLSEATSLAFFPTTKKSKTLTKKKKSKKGKKGKGKTITIKLN